MKKIRYFIEYICLKFFLFIIDILPLSTATRLVSTIADIWYFLNSSRRKIALENILKSKITDNKAQATEIARNSFRHFAILILESLKSGRELNKENWQEKVELDIDSETMSILKQSNQGIILATGHIGNWEIAAQMISYLKPIVGITRTMNNPYVEKIIQKRKPGNKFRLTPKHDANSVRFISILKKGEILALMIDQHALSRGVIIDFFGRPASTHTSPALLHLVTKVPLCFGYCIRTGSMRYKLTALKPLIHKPTGNKNEDIRAILKKLTEDLEKIIKQYPEQYLWGHRRWRNNAF